MSDQTTDAGAGAAGAQDQTPRKFRVQKMYLKDVSYEAPAVPGFFSRDNSLEPKISLQLNTEHRALTETLHEVVVAVTVTAADPEQDRTVFLVEIKQAGLFEVEGFAGDELNHLLGSYCPGMLFPFAREVVAGLVQKGGMPPLLLQPINFDALYAEQVARRQQTDDAPETTQ